MPLGCLPRERPALLSPQQILSGFQKDSSPSPAGVEILQAGRTLGTKEMLLVLKASSSGRCYSVAKSWVETRVAGLKGTSRGRVIQHRSDATGVPAATSRVPQATCAGAGQLALSNLFCMVDLMVTVRKIGRM
ncbi:unnamed protein product [Rangifer tarandus platyrhynchus]|uniref:Uncharacterized protein n=1 Tax=Rangifer tarandus platyrhynchus TaxID=3082113 RepID=A0AC59ZSD9_RANTA